MVINERIIERFAILNQNNRLAHAYLLVGPFDIGKSETALSIAKLVNCERRKDGLFCDHCPSCRKIAHGNHPDIHMIISNNGETIKIEQIRRLLSEIQLRPYEGQKKVFILKNVENFTLEASNAILKTLEEPTRDSLLLLTTSVLEKNLDTIKSRCHIVHFFPLSKRKLASQLTKEYDITEDILHFLAGFSEGCLGRARHLYHEKLFQKKDVIIDSFIHARDDEIFIKRFLADKEKTKEILCIIASWFRDLILLKSGVKEGDSIHFDRLKELKCMKERYSFEDLNDIFLELVKMLKLFDDNLNLKIALTLVREKIYGKNSAG